MSLRLEIFQMFHIQVEQKEYKAVFKTWKTVQFHERKTINSNEKKTP